MMNCTELDAAIDDARAVLVESDGGFYVACGGLTILSLLLLTMGEQLVRPMGSIVAGTATALFVYVLSDAFDGLPCMARIGVAAVAAILAALLVLFLFKAGVFVLGAASFGALAHYIYEALPLGDVEPPFQVFGRSAYYYLALALAGLLGAVLAHKQRKSLVRISTSLLGGGGVALTVHLVAERSADDGVHPLVLLVLVVVSTVGGVFVQHRLAERRKRRKERPRETVAQGLPVYDTK